MLWILVCNIYFVFHTYLLKWCTPQLQEIQIIAKRKQSSIAQFSCTPYDSCLISLSPSIPFLSAAGDFTQSIHQTLGLPSGHHLDFIITRGSAILSIQYTCSSHCRLFSSDLHPSVMVPNSAIIEILICHWSLVKWLVSFSHPNICW